MEFSSTIENRRDDIVALFTETFTASEGAVEGALIGALAGDLIDTTDPNDRFIFAVVEDGAIAGCIIFSRLSFEGDTRRVFLLAPVAVAPDRQGRGVGQALLRHGLEVLRAEGVDVAMTYGDPAYYGKVGFRQVSQIDAPPPLALTQPEGWLAQSLNERAFTPLKGPSRCVSALDSPDYW